MPSRLAVLESLTRNEEVIRVDLETVSTIVILVTTIVGSHAMLRRELRSDIKDVRDDLRRLDDRVYQLASGLKPLIDEAERQS